MTERPGPASPREEIVVEEILTRYKERVDRALDELLPAESEAPTTLHQAMRYSVFAGGKRLRPALLLAAGRACGAGQSELLPAACAVELVHTYSLIHDDLPAFDDDDVRRGSPTSHVVFGEAVAILAGDALQAEAFRVLAEAAEAGLDPRPVSRALGELTRAAGSRGMCGGQYLDVAAEGTALDLDTLRSLHGAKTGALLTACVRMGGHLAGADEALLAALARYGDAVGLAFQIVDDILDVEGSLEDLGKRPGTDALRGKPTYPALLGVDGARREATELRERALAALEPFGDAAQELEALARFVVDRVR